MGVYSDGSKKDLTAASTWSSSSTAIATVGPDGLVSTMAPGTTTIGAALSGVSGSVSLTVTAASLASIGVTPAKATLAVGSLQQFTAMGVYTDNSTHELSGDVNWSSSNTTVATIGDTGLATTLAPGSTSIVAMLNGVYSPAVTLTVTGASLQSIAITPAAPSLAAGASLQFQAIGSFSDGSTQNLTSLATWSSSSAATATISNATGSSGLAKSLSTGTTSITASLNGLSAPAVTLTVTPAVLVSIAVAPATASVAAGTRQQFTATGTFTDLSTQDLTATAVWNSSDLSTASISNASGSEGSATGLQTGQATITAQVGPVISSPAMLTITAAALVSISVTPAAPIVTSGNTEQFTATGTYTDSSTQNLTTSASWTSSNTAVATISNATGTNGLATSLAVGGTQITAASGGIVSAAVALQVIMPIESVLYSFGGTSPDGAYPQAGLILATDGNFYGTTYSGGANNVGAIYRMSSAGVETLLYSFGANAADASYPKAGLVQGADGNFYGTSFYGGVNGAGTVFKLTPAGVETVIYAFGATAADGISPQAGLMQAGDGNFYGTTTTGGSNNKGTVFEVSPAGIETVLYSFGATATDGVYPQAGVIQGGDGNFYGTTTNGGANNSGTVFKVTPAGAETVLYSLGSTATDGVAPQGGLIQGSDGNFYGTTDFGGANNAGTVFEVTPAGVESLLYSFGTVSNDGVSPQAALIQASDGNFYGTTASGGANDKGTVFQVTPAGVETVLNSFGAGSTDGTYPEAGLIQGSDGNLYGTTANGGAYSRGTVFVQGFQ